MRAKRPGSVANQLSRSEPFQVIEHVSHEKAIPNETGYDGRDGRSPARLFVQRHLFPQEPVDRKQRESDHDDMLFQLEHAAEKLQAVPVKKRQHAHAIWSVEKRSD